LNCIQVIDLQCTAERDYAEVSARIEGLPARSGAQRLRFRFPIALKDSLHDGAEPFVAALLPIAMSLRKSLRAEGKVSPVFHSGIEQIIHLYHGWDRRLARIDVQIAASAPTSHKTRAVGCFFTGGVDSFYTVLKNLEQEGDDSRITDLIFIRGYADCPLENRVLFKNLSARLGKVARELDLRLILAETNLRSFTPASGLPWDWHAGSQLAAVGLCLIPMLRRLYIPAGDTYSTLSPWGSHPLVDPLWSTESLEFRHDGCEAFRSQKLDRYVARSRLALENLRVCGYDSTGLRNCGTCEKCLRTMIGLTALGVNLSSEVFTAPLDLKCVRRLKGVDRIIGYYLRDNLKLLTNRNSVPALGDAVRDALRPNGARWLLRHLQGAVREADRRYLNGRARAWVLKSAGQSAERQSELRSSPAKSVVREAWRTVVHKRGPIGGVREQRYISNTAVNGELIPAVCLGGGFGGVILMSLVRSLGRMKIPVWVLSNREDSPARFSRFCQEIRVPDVESDPEGLEQALVNQARALLERPVLFVTSDAEILFVAERREWLGQYYRIACPTAQLARDLIDKRTQYKLVERLRLPMPHTYHGIASSDAQSSDFEFPLVIKPAISNQWPLGRQKAVVVEDAFELERQLRDLERIGSDVVVQSAIPGPPSQLYTVLAYVGLSGEPLIWGTYRKVRQYPVDFGMGAVVEAVSVPTLEETALRLLRGLGFTGPCGIEFKQDPRDGIFRFIEINPRFELQHSLVAAAGADLAKAMYADLTGYPPPSRRPYRTGISWMALNLELKACRELAARGEFSWKNWAGSLRGLRREALFAWDDPLPGFESYLATLRNIVRKHLRSRPLRTSSARPATSGDRTRQEQ